MTQLWNLSSKAVDRNIFDFFLDVLMLFLATLELIFKLNLKNGLALQSYLIFWQQQKIAKFSEYLKYNE